MIKIGKIDQVGLVVDNIEKKIKEFEALGIGPFTTMSLNDLPITYRDEELKVDMKIALAHTDTVQIELIEAKGKSFYTDFLKKHGEGLNHLGIYVENIDEELKKYLERGIGIIQSGDIYGVRWIYLDTIDILGFVLELIEVP